MIKFKRLLALETVYLQNTISPAFLICTVISSSAPPVTITMLAR